MATDCVVCGRRLSRKARVCNVCGEPTDPSGSAGYARALAASAAAQQDVAAVAEPDHTAGQLTDGTTRPRRVRLLLLAGVVTVVLALSGTYAALRSAPPRAPDGAAYGVVQLSADPGLRWQHPVAQVAPELRCPTAATEAASATYQLCSVTTSATVGDTVVVSVQRSQHAELVGLARADGEVKWHKSAPAGSTYNCMVLNKRLWCLTVPLIYQVVTNDSPIADTDSLFSSGPRRSASYSSAVLTRLEPSTGAILNSSPVSGSTAGAAFVGIGFGGFYVLGRGSDSAGTVIRFSMNGAPQWNHLLTLVQPRKGLLVPNPQVYERAGAALVSFGEVAGRQAVFSVEGGTPVRSASGHVVTVVGGIIVTQTGSTVLSIGPRKVPENAVAALPADDRSTAEPVLSYRFSDADPDPYSLNDPTPPTVVVRAPADPLRTTHRLQEGDEPIAYCGGVIVSAMTNVYSGINPTSGARVWVVVGDAGLNPQIRCTGSEVVIANEYRATAISVKNGAQVWSVSYPVGSAVTDSGYGDPEDGLVVGPSRDAGIGANTTSLSYLR